MRVSARHRRLLRIFTICLAVSSFCLFSVWVVFGSTAGHTRIAERTDLQGARSDQQISPKEDATTKSTSNAPKVPSTTSSTTTASTTKGKQVDLPAHVRELFAVKELKLVALDPIILKCLTTGSCMHLTASASVQVGTFLKDTTELQAVFEAHLNVTGWKINVLCPHAAIVTKHYWKGFDKKVAVSVISDDPSKHYFKVEQETNAEITERAFDRFNTTEMHGVAVPEDIPRFELWWNNGEFISCNETLAERFVANSTIITPEHISNLKKFTNMLLATGQIPSLAFGTLLGWYRNCGVIPYTTDIDVAVKVAEYQEEFVESLKKKKDFRLLRFIGAKEYGLEISVNIPGTVKNAYVDVFYLFPHNSTYDWAPTTYGKSSGWMRLKTLVPKVDRLCTGDVLGFLFFVPCNYIDLIVTSYGKTEWLEPQKSYVYTGHDRLTFRDGNWNETLNDVIQNF